MGIIDRLGPDDWAQLRNELFQPAHIPPVFLGYMVDYLGVNQPMIPISNIFGYSQNAAQQNQVGIATPETTTSAAYTDLATVGPTLSGLVDGNYLLIFGGTAGSSGGAKAYMSPSVDAVAATDTDAGYVAATGGVGLVRAVISTMTGAPSAGHSVTIKYRVISGTGSFDNRWLIAQRYSNL